MMQRNRNFFGMRKKFLRGGKEKTEKQDKMCYGSIVFRKNIIMKNNEKIDSYEEKKIIT